MTHSTHRSAPAGSAVSPTSRSAVAALVLLAWVVALVAAFAASGALAGEFSADYATPGSESQPAGDLLAERFPAPLVRHRRPRVDARTT